ncbi:FAS1 domain-containing protein SELMODRAFT_448915-like [Aristolochia californica]|uniref:FAS1 domain-containing protein SELMODRAFT_448915-like n=1 Tax=Aristolochia californica TaxID=171875 RepID=UPI0035D77D3D
METYLTLILLVGFILPTIAADEPTIKEDLLVAIREMQTADYFTFVMLLKMKHENIPPNVTFLMPNDKMLSSVSLPDNAVSDFLSRHSVPSPLLFDCLSHFPTGSVIPTRELNFTLRVSNEGRRRFYLDNVRIIRPNVCSTGSSIRCHGIDGVLMLAPQPKSDTPLHPCATTPIPPPTPQEPRSALTPVPESMSPLPMVPTLNLTPPSPSPPRANPDSPPQKSDSIHLQKEGLLDMIIFFSVLSLMANQI